ncbi:MAG: hypothetical protein Greene041679_577 [Parcubacteria group bacterium Greene0416_79]|nr:MAG: hypothetical protein Greene041679_577 [Parcubacteria group bacterium Greene0416_79]
MDSTATYVIAIAVIVTDWVLLLYYLFTKKNG